VILKFGKHVGRRAGEIAIDDPGYLRWVLRAEGMPEDLIAVVARVVSP
jgi:hypothetical protein